MPQIKEEESVNRIENRGGYFQCSSSRNAKKWRSTLSVKNRYGFFPTCYSEEYYTNGSTYLLRRIIAYFILLEWRQTTSKPVHAISFYLWFLVEADSENILINKNIFFCHSTWELTDRKSRTTSGNMVLEWLVLPGHLLLELLLTFGLEKMK